MNWEYVAGFFDGEGSAGCYMKNGRVGQRFINFSNTSLETLEAIQAFLGAGRVALQHTATPTRRPCYVLYIRRIDDLRRIAPELRARCIIKREALDRVLADIEGREGARNSGRIRDVGPETVRRLYWDEEFSTGEIAERLGVRAGSVREFMVRHDIPRRSAADAYVLSGRYGVAGLGREEIRRLYWDEGLSLHAIAERVGTTHAAVGNFMVRHEIPRRSKSAAAKRHV